jgi:hypothetical protein
LLETKLIHQNQERICELRKPVVDITEKWLSKKLDDNKQIKDAL